MSKTKKLLIQIVGCLVLGTVIGVAFWIFDGRQAGKKASEGRGGVSNAQIKPVEVHTGVWHKDYLEVIGK